MTIDELIGGTSTAYEDLVDKINRQQDHLDSLTNSVVIVANGSVTLTYDPGTKIYPSQTIPISSGTNNGYMAYVERSDQPTKLYALPYFETSLASNQLLISASITVVSGSLTAQVGITTTYPTPPATFTFYYYIIQQSITQV